MQAAQQHQLELLPLLSQQHPPLKLWHAEVDSSEPQMSHLHSIHLREPLMAIVKIGLPVANQQSADCL